MGKKVLVTGAGGFIGSHLVERLVRDGHEVRAWSGTTAATTGAISTHRPAREGVHRGPSRRPEGPGGGPRRRSAGREWVFHLGALIAIPYSYQNPHDVVQTNVVGTAHVLDACRASVAPGAGRADLDVRGLRHGPVCPDRRGAPLAGAVALRGDQDRRRCAGPELPSGVRPAGGDPAAVQHLRPSPVGPGDHPDDHQPGADAAGREARQPGAAPRPDVRQGHGRRASSAIAGCDAAIGRVVNIGRGEDVSIGELVERIGARLGRRAAGRDRPRSASGRRPARSAACSPAPPWRSSSGAGSRNTRSTRARRDDRLGPRQPRPVPGRSVHDLTDRVHHTRGRAGRVAIRPGSGDGTREADTPARHSEEVTQPSRRSASGRMRAKSSLLGQACAGGLQVGALPVALGSVSSA